jgi:FMN reductase
MKIAVIVGNPKANSRTLEAATALARQIGGQPATVLDLATFGPALLEWGNTMVATAIETARAADLCIFASPTYKASYTGLLKLFLDQFPPRGLEDKFTVPLMLGAAPDHALAPELHLRPVLSELGAICPLGGLYLIDKTFMDDPKLAAYAKRMATLLQQQGL